MLALLAALVVSLPSPRQVIDLDSGWEFAGVPKAPSIWRGPDAVPTSSWKVIQASSQETEKENDRAENAFDGDSKTIWHSQWGTSQPGYPHELVVDLGSRVEAVGVRILPRQSSPQNGRPKSFDLYLSDRVGQWDKPVLSGELPDSSDLYEKRFGSTSGRYLRLVFKTGQRAEPFLALSEIGLIRKLDLKSQTGWNSQYNIASVTVGDSRFDLHGAALELVKKGELKSIGGRVWQGATLPHAAWIRPMGSSEIWQGVAYYRRKLDLPFRWRLYT